MIVVDASAAVDFLIKSQALPQLVDRISGEAQLMAPSLIAYEVGSALRRHWLARDLSEARVLLAINDFHKMNFQFFAAETLFERAWQLRHNISFYDAGYVALAEMFGIPLVTCDKRLASTTGHHAEVLHF